jgi:hypothetical protein
MFQTRLGRKISKAIAQPAQNQREANRRYRPERRRPASSAKPKRPMEYLFSRPSPATTPNQIQRRALPVRTMQMSSQAQPIQKSGSKLFMLKK